ncbi:hypothetical protein M434DRAFT_359701 [Hypoxylon sp. CO27-5]|nr:hypothetical protein M434DRAFT_359701 [Hypoxylon sp. CO27-5]
MMVSGHQFINHISHYVAVFYAAFISEILHCLSTYSVCTLKAASSHLRIKRTSSLRRNPVLVVFVLIWYLCPILAGGLGLSPCSTVTYVFMHRSYWIRWYYLDFL